MLKRFLLGALAALCLVSQVAAQSSVLPYWINSSGVKVPTGSGNPLPVSGTFSATLGGFAPATKGTPITATTGGATGSLPAGAVVVATNVGTTNGVYCELGASATTAAQYIAPNGGWFAFTVGASTQLTCITSSSTTTVNMVGGSGLPTGTGGGGGGSGGGGAVTVADGADVTQGALADAAATAGGTGSLSAKMRLMTTQLNTINTTLGSPLQAGGTVTANLGTLNGAATAANQSSQLTQETATATALGAPADSVCGTATGTCSMIALAKYLNTAANSSIPAGTNLIGDVNLRQGGSALSTTNGAYFNQLQGNAVLSATNPTFTRLTDGTNAASVNPCQRSTPASVPININTATTTRLVTPSASNKTYICSMFVISAGTQNIGIVEGTGGTCGTGTAGVIGGTTAGTGPNLTAQTGWTLGSGAAPVAATAGTNVDFCFITSAAVQVSGVLTYVQQP